VVLFVLALAAGFTLLPLSFNFSRAAHAEPLAPTTYTITGTSSVGEGALFRHQPNLRYARMMHTATLLPDGKVLIAGGRPGAAADSAELYDPATETFTPTNNLLSGREWHTATLLPNGKVLIAGGLDDISSPAYTELYDPATGVFTPTGNMIHSRHRHTATLLEDGRVLIVGGQAAPLAGGRIVTETELYDPASNTFTLTTPIAVERSSHTATLLPDGKVLVAGGSWDANGTAEVYDPTTESWTPPVNMKHEHSYHTATLLEDGKVLIAGNYIYADDNSAELYDGTTGQFTSLGSMDIGRAHHTATRLPNGYVVFVGMHPRVSFYIPGTNQFKQVYLLRETRNFHTATLLQNGHVLIAGGQIPDRGIPLATTALGSYLPANTFTGSLTLPPNWIASRTVQMSISGTTSAAPIDAYALTEDADINQVTWTPATSGQVISITRTFPRDGTFLLNLYFRDVNVQRSRPIQTFVYVDSAPPVTTTMSVLPATSPTTITLNWNGVDHYSGVATHDVEVRVGTSGEWTPVVTGTSARSITYHAPERGRTYYFRARATDKVGHVQPWPSSPNTFTRVPNLFTGTLQVPGGWLTSASGSVSFSGTSVGDPVSAASLSNNGSTWGAWMGAAPGESQTVTWNFGADGANKSVYLRFRDTYGDISSNIIEHVNVDTVAPASTMTALPATSPGTFQVAWSGSDATSGITSYDVEVREGTGGEWTPLLSATTATATSFTGQNGTTYYFRARARDEAGHVEAWPGTYDTYTKADTEGPTGAVTINAGALSTTSRSVLLYLPASDALSTVTQMRLSSAGTTWGAWQSYTTPFAYTLPATDELKTVSIQFRDQHGNVSATASDTIRLDEAAGSDELVTINNGALWTNSTSVTLTISAPARTSNMRLSNDGGFAGTGWQLFESRPTWNIIPYGSYAIPRTVYVRVRNIDGTESTVYSDDIIYDPVPPTGTLSIQSVTSSSVNVNLRASDPDNLSGVAAMRVALTSNLSQVAWQPYASSRTLPRNGTAPENVRAYAQFRDGAGNVSTVVCAAASGSCAAGGSTATATATATRTPTRTPGATATPSRTPTPSATNPPQPSARRPYSDFNGDGRSDILWRHLQTGENALYQMNGGTIEQKLPISVTPIGYKVVGIGDFNGDGKADILLRHSTTGLNYLFLMNGATIVRKVAINTVADLNWTVAGVADFTGDGKADILWRNIQTGENALYQMNGGTIEQNLPINVTPIGYKVVGVGDFNGDARADILLRHSTTGANYVFLMNGATIVRKQLINTVSDLKWTVAGVAEFTGDGKADILWRNVQTGENALYRMNGVVIEQNLPINVTPTGYRIAGVGDFSGDGKADILLRHSTTGLNYLFVMNGATIVRKQVINTEADLKWTIMNHDYLVYGPATQAAATTTSSSRGAWPQPPDEPGSASLVVVPGDMGGAGVEEAADLPDSGASGGVPEGVGAGQTEEVPEELELDQPVSLPGGDVSHWLFLPSLQRR
jgi:hypothetical protein